MVLGVKTARFCVFTAKNSQLRESTHDGVQSTFRQEKKLIEEEKKCFQGILRNKKGILHEEECLIIIFIPYIIYSINITQQPELLHDGCKKQESNP